MKLRKNSSRDRLKLIRTVTLFICVVTLFLLSVVRAQQSSSLKRVLVLYWYDKDFHSNARFEGAFKTALRSAPAGTVEYYPEYLESNRFPGENQSLLLRDYLRQKYADRTIDVVIATADASLDFLLKHRANLFPRTPIVFTAVKSPTAEQVAAGSGLTGFLSPNTHGKTIDLALRLHPGTEHVFIISGTLEHDKRFETPARKELENYDRGVQITYLTDLSVDELIAKTKSLPERSIILYLWQQSHNEQGTVLESADVLASFARFVQVPIYGMNSHNVGGGIIGGYVFSMEVCATRLAEIALRIANGTRVQDIPIESAPTVPMFDWRELRRWGVSEEELPAGYIVRFKESTLWEEHKWRIIGIISVCLLEAFLIAGLLIQRARRRRVEAALAANQERFALAQGAGQVGAFDWDIQKNIIQWSEEMKLLYGLQQHGSNVMTENWLKHIHPQDYAVAKAAVESAMMTGEIDVEWRVIWPDKSIRWLHVRGKCISQLNGRSLRMVGVNVDITERKRAEEALLVSEVALRESYERVEDLAGRLIVAQEVERKHIAREIHDDLNQQVAALAIGLRKLNIQLIDTDSPTRNLITKLEDRTTQLSDRMRQISHELHSSILEHVGLPEALKSYSSEFTEQQGIAVALDIQDNARNLPADVSLCLYRVVQESLRNIAKHSGAKSAQVTLARTDAAIELCVADKGVGFDPNLADSRRGLGLISLEERVKLMHGRFEVKSHPGSGTELRVCIPLKGEKFMESSDHFSTVTP